MSMPSSSTKPRAASQEKKVVRKSRTGCITCRIRRVKCDETRPQCNRCQVSQRNCDGYLPPDAPVSRRQLAEAVRHLATIGPASQTLHLPLPPYIQHRIPSPSDCVFFDTFRHSTGPATASFMPSVFWTRELLQLAHAEPAIWHATLALGALHRRWDTEEPILFQPGEDRVDFQLLTRKATVHYVQAMSLAKSLNDPSKLKALSIVMAAIANLLGRWADGGMHVRAGLRLLEGEGENTAVDAAAEILERLDMQSMTFSESRSPYKFEEAIWLRGLDRKLQELPDIPSYSIAATTLFAYQRRYMLEMETYARGDMSQSEFELGQEKLALDVVHWENKMHRFEATAPVDQLSALSVRFYHVALRLFLAVEILGPETRWDLCLIYFERIVILAEAIISHLQSIPKSSFSLEPAVIIPLYITAHRCRHPILRRWAVALLRQHPRQEGMWKSGGAAAVAERIISVEDKAPFQPGMPPPIADRTDAERAADLTAILGMPWSAWSADDSPQPLHVTWTNVEIVPDEDRVIENLVVVALDCRRANLSLMVQSPNSVPPYRIQEEVVHF